MITLQQQVCSLELARKLKELGVKQESLFYWQQHYQEMKGDVSASSFKITQTKTESEKGMRCFSAFTVAELGEMLPQYSSFTKVEDFLWEGYEQINGNIEEYSGTTEADARAKMLIYLLENKLITLK